MSGTAVSLDLTNRDTLLRSLPHGGTVVEVGVWRGDFAATILRENNPRELWLVDCWQAQPGTVYEQVDWAAREDHEANLEHVLWRFSLDPRVCVMPMFSAVAARSTGMPCVDIVYLDADHTRAGIDADLVVWWPKVKPGGWLTGHDYLDTAWSQVRSAVDAFAADRGLQVLVTRERNAAASWAIQKT